MNHKKNTHAPHSYDYDKIPVYETADAPVLVFLRLGPSHPQPEDRSYLVPSSTVLISLMLSDDVNAAKVAADTQGTIIRACFYHTPEDLTILSVQPCDSTFLPNFEFDPSLL